jgi:hypothetical protein
MTKHSDLARHQAEIWARALHAAREALWQHHGQPTDEGYARIQSDAEVAARAAFQWPSLTLSCSAWEPSD